MQFAKSSQPPGHRAWGCWELVPRGVQESRGIIFIQNCLVDYLCVFRNLTAKASFVCVCVCVCVHPCFVSPLWFYTASQWETKCTGEWVGKRSLPGTCTGIQTHTVFVKFWICVLLAGPGVRSEPRGPSRHVIWPPDLSFIRGRLGVFKQNSWPGRPTGVGRDSFLPAPPH